MFSRLVDSAYEIYTIKPDGSFLNGTGVEQLTDNQWEDGTPAWQSTRQ
jgi:hypothetical protein